MWPIIGYDFGEDAKVVVDGFVLEQFVLEAVVVAAGAVVVLEVLVVAVGAYYQAVQVDPEVGLVAAEGVDLPTPVLFTTLNMNHSKIFC